SKATWPLPKSWDHWLVELLVWWTYPLLTRGIQNCSAPMPAGVANAAFVPALLTSLPPHCSTMASHSGSSLSVVSKHQVPPLVTLGQSAASSAHVLGGCVMPAAFRILGLYHSTVTEVSLNGNE